MSASIGMKRKNVGMDYLKRTAGIITGATGSYIHEAMPVTTSTLSEAKSTVSSVSAAFAQTAQSIFPRVRQLKAQTTFRRINTWFMENESTYGDASDVEYNFDIDTDTSEIAEAQISESEKNATHISQAVIQSSHKLVEAQIGATANLIETAAKQTAVITTGFDETNKTLNKILEVLTKNTATLIETNVVSNSSEKANNNLLSNGRFNLSEYKKIVAGNMKNSQMGSMASLATMMMNPEMLKMIKPQDIVGFILGGALDKKVPNLKKNMASLDKAISDTIMTSLVRLGENNSNGLGGNIARMLGINGNRKSVDTTRSVLELKTVPFDSIAHESITNTIPGYLRKILVALGGQDEIYDYRSRSFKTTSSIKKDFFETAKTTGGIYNASSKVRRSMGDDDFSQMIYDMMMTDLGSKTQGGVARDTIDNFKDVKSTRSYLLNTVLKDVSLNQDERKAVKRFAQNLSNASDGTGALDIMNQVSRTNANRNSRMEEYVRTANAYNTDLSSIKDNTSDELKAIAQSYGKAYGRNNSSSSVNEKPNPVKNLIGVNYANKALYEIFRKLNEGINVFQVGSKRIRQDQFKKWGDRVLPPPLSHKPRPLNSKIEGAPIISGGSSQAISGSPDPNLLRNQEQEDGTTENLTTGQRFMRWGKNRGGGLMRAMFNGSPEDVRNAFTLMIRDVGQVTGDGIKKGAAKINQSSGNFAGYLKHKITGAGYTYKDDDGNDIVVEANDKKGILGYFDQMIFGEGGAKGLMSRTKDAGSRWFKSVAGYFNYGNNNNPDDQRVAGKRKKIIGSSVGAMLGMGILGGPFGILMGGLAGSAISQTDGIGDKIKKILFGDKEHQGDKRKDRNKRRGLIGRAVDNIVDPIRFQIGKTMTAFGAVLKKNILGPLSNIGAAIKERMANAAGGVVSKVFGKIFNGAFGVLKKLIMLPLDIARAPINMFGMGARGAAEVGGAVTGGVLNSIAKGIAGKSGRTVINDRIKSQRQDARVDMARSGYFGEYELDEDGNPVLDSKGRPKKLSRKRSYKLWKESEDARRDRMGSIDDFTAEKKHVMTDEERAAIEASKMTEENTRRTADVTSQLADAVTGEIIPGSSFKSHDQGVHDRLDSLVEILGGNHKHKAVGSSIKSDDVVEKSNSSIASIADAVKQSSVDHERDQFSSGAIAAAAQFSTSNDEITNNESRLTTSIFDEAAKPKTSKQVISAKLKELMGIQKDKSEEKVEKKESLFDKIFKVLSKVGEFITSPLGIAGLIASILGLTNNLGPVLEKFKDGAENLFEWITKGGEKENAPLNAITSPFGFRTDSELNYFNPLAPMHHVNKDAGGNNIVNQNATRSTNAAWRQAGIQSGRNLISAGLQWGMGSNAMDLANYGQATAHGMNMRQNLSNASGSLTSRSMKTMGTLGVRAGTGVVLGKGANYIATNVAEKFGIDENTSAMLGRGAEAATQITAMAGKGPAGYVAKKITNSVVEDGGLLNKIAKELVKLLKSLANKLASTKAFKAVAGPLKELISKFASKIGAPALKKLGSVVTKIFARETVEAGAQTATLGIGTAVMALGGGAIGATNAATLFRVMPNDVDPLMTTISAALGAVFDGLPYVGLVEIVDLIIAPVNDGKGVRQIIAEAAYKGLMGDDKLDMKQSGMAKQLDKYNQEWGTNLDTAEFNDAVNEGFWKRTWHGKQVLDEEGNVETYEDGSFKKSGGFKGLFVGSDKKFVKDANGAVLRGEDGKGIQAVDKYGQGLKKDKKWGDHVGNFFGGIGRFFAGGTEYETDENGQALYDSETGEFKVKEKKGNIFQRGGAAISDWWGGKEVTNPDGSVTKTKGFAEAASTTMSNIGKTIAKPFQDASTAVADWWGGKEIMGPDGKMTKTEGFADSAKKTLGNISSAIAKPFQDAGSAIAKWWGGEYETDENGNPIKDENGNPVKKGGFKQWASKGIGKFTSTAGNIVRGVTSTTKDWVLGEYERDEEGNPIMDEDGNPIRKGGLVGWVKGGLGKLNSTFIEPAKDMVKGAKDWISNKASWISDGAKSAGDWLITHASNMWENISSPVKDALNGAKDWVSDKAAWIAEGAGNAFDWISTRASSMWKTISDPVKDFVGGAKDWVENKADWLSEKAKDAGSWISEKAGAAWKFISDPVKDAVSGASDWVSNKAAWISDKAKDAKDWIFTNTGKLFDSITDNVKGLVDGASTWATEKAAWVKEGIKDVGDWIGKKAASIWDWITGGIDKLANKGEQDKRDEEYIKSRQSSGGTGGANIGGLDDSVADKAIDIATNIGLHSMGVNVPKTTSTITEGGNPLNKPYSITSPFGQRSAPYSGFHKGIDLVPSGSKEAEVGSRFSGTVENVVSGVSNSDHAFKNSNGEYYYPGKNAAGNYVKIKADNGISITNMHLKAGSIPDNVKPGARVNIGDKIGEMGTTGWSTGPHLHYQLEDQSGKPFDPSSSIKGGSTLTSFNSSGSSSLESSSDSSSSTVSNETGKNEGPLAKLLSSLKIAGVKFLSSITGGLISDELAGSPSAEIGNTYSEYGSYAGYTGSCKNASDFLKLCAAEIGTTENPPNSNKVKYGEWFGMNGQPWCMMFVQWCFDKAGLTLPYKSASCYNSRDWWKANHPDKVYTNNPKPGDIVIFGTFSHTGIVESDNGNQITTIEGNTSSNDSGSQNNGGCVARKKRNKSDVSVYIRAVDFEQLSRDVANKGSMPSGVGEDIKALWSYFKGIGYSDNAIAGILGCWTSESSNKPRTIEGDYLPGFPGYDTLINDRQAMNNYTQNTVFAHTRNVKKEAYRGKDGNYYPGIGLAQWTGPRGEALIKFAKQNNADWGSMSTQLGYLNTELNGGYSKVKGMINSASSPEEAAGAFCSNFEGYNQSSGVSVRKQNARKLLQQYGGTGGGMGGSPTIGSPDYKPNAKDIKALRDEFGVDDESSTISNRASMGGSNGPITKHNPSYKKPNINKMIIKGPHGMGGTESSLINPAATDNIATSPTGDLSKVISMMSSILSELSKISNNTGTSSELLGSLNEKDFIDKGLRDSITAVNNAQKKNTNRHSSMNTNNARTIAAMARPS